MAGQTNLRVIYDNIVDYSTTTITPSSTQSAQTTSANLKTDVKSQVWRSATNSSSAQSSTAVLLVDFSSGNTAIPIGGAVSAYTNLSNTGAQMRVRGYNTPALPTLGGTVAVPTITENTTIGTDINAVIFTGSLYVAVGSACRCMTSTDGKTWTYAPGLATAVANTAVDATCAIWSGSKIIVGLSNGNTVQSTDFITWTLSTSLSGTAWGSAKVNAITRVGGGVFVVGGPSGKIATSSDGVTWTNQTSLSSGTWGASSSVNSLTYGSTVVVAVGASGKVATSTDGVTWTYQANLSGGTWGTGNCLSVIYGGSKFVVVGAVSRCATSTDGVTWTYQSGLASASGWTSQTAQTLLYDGTGYAVGSAAGKLATSSDAATWTNRASAATQDGAVAINSLQVQGGLYTAYGATGMTMNSTDSINWTSTTSVSQAAGFSNTAVFDTGYVLACPWNSLTYNTSGTAPAGSSSYNYGGGTHARTWLTTAQQVAVAAVVIELVDNYSYWKSGGYIEVSRLVLGKYWSPTFNTGFGLSTTIKDLSAQSRTEAGDLNTRRGPRYGSMSFDLKWLNAADRVSLTQVILGNGLTKSMLISLFPDNSSDWEKERAHQMYGRFTSINGITIDNPFTYGSKVDFEEI